jgi:hypothetical protein
MMNYPFPDRLKHLAKVFWLKYEGSIDGSVNIFVGDASTMDRVSLLKAASDVAVSTLSRVTGNVPTRDDVLSLSGSEAHSLWDSLMRQVPAGNLHLYMLVKDKKKTVHTYLVRGNVIERA